MFIPDPELEFLPIPDPGSRGQKGTGPRTRIRNTVYNCSILAEYLTRDVLFYFKHDSKQGPPSVTLKYVSQKKEVYRKSYQ
jgi:hypothetical protein